MRKVRSNGTRRALRGGVAGTVLAFAGVLALPLIADAAPRLAPVPHAQWNDEQRAALGPHSAAPTNLVATYLHHPKLAASVLPFENYIANESTLPPRHRALLALRTAWLSKSEYLWAQRVPAAREAGVDATDIERVARGPDASGWNATDAAVVRAVDELFVDAYVADPTWKTLSGVYNVAQLVDLPFTVGTFIIMAGTANSLGVEIEADRRDRFPSGISHAPVARVTNERLIGRTPRIAPLPREQWSPEMKKLLDPNDSGRQIANVYPTYAQSLTMDILRRPVGEHIRNDTTLTDRQREILLLRIGVLCRAEYEWAAHYRIGLRSGLSEADIDGIVAGPDRGEGDPVENLLMKAVDELHRDTVVSQDTWTALDRTFDDRQVLDILLAIGGYRMFSMAMNTYGVQLDPNGTRFPEHLR